MKNRFTWLAAGAIISLGIMVFSSLKLAQVTAARFHGSLIQSSTPAPDFSLADSNSQTFTLSAEKGKVVLLFFGYTTCPDVCPATMAQFTRLKADLGKQANNIDLVMITVDPRRDTPEAISKYLASFDPAIRGLWGTPEELAAVWKQYGVAVEYTPGATPDGYMVSHTDRLYVIDRSGKLRLTYSPGTPQGDLEDDVRLLLKEKAG